MTVDYAHSLANPVPQKLAGFAMTAILLNIHNAGYYGLSTMNMGMVICYGGLARSIAGITEWRRGNTFGTIVFVSHGCFLLSLICIWIRPLLGLPAAAPVSTGWHLPLWGLFNFILFICILTGKANDKLFFGSLVVLLACARPRTLSAAGLAAPLPVTRRSVRRFRPA